MKKILFGIAIILFSAMCYVIYREMRWDIVELLYVFGPFVGLAIAGWGAFEKDK